MHNITLPALSVRSLYSDLTDNDRFQSLFPSRNGGTCAKLEAINLSDRQKKQNKIQEIVKIKDIFEMTRIVISTSIQCVPFNCYDHVNAVKFWTQYICIVLYTLKADARTI